MADVEQPVGDHGRRCRGKGVTANWPHDATYCQPPVMAPADLFPSEGHRYLSEQQLDALRYLAVSGGHVVVPGRLLLELICDIRNLAAALAVHDGGGGTVA